MSLDVSFSYKHPYTGRDWDEVPDGLDLRFIGDGSVDVTATVNMGVSNHVTGGSARLNGKVVELYYETRSDEDVIFEQGTFYLDWHIKGLNKPRDLEYKLMT